MKRSEINAAILEAAAAFIEHDWVLPPNPRWDVTDFGLGNFAAQGLVLVLLSEQTEYCEKLLYVRRHQVIPSHAHRVKKEDIICRWGRIAVAFRSDEPTIPLQVNGEWRKVPCDSPLFLRSGERVTVTSGIRHEFWVESEYAIVGEVSTQSGDFHDNLFDTPQIGRSRRIEEDEQPLLRLLSDS